MRIFARSGVTLHIGRAGENFTTEVAFDITSWFQEFGSQGNLCLTIEQPGEDLYCYMAPEPPQHRDHVEIITAGGDTYFLWKVDDHDTSHTYMGKCQLQYEIGGRVVKSAIYDIIVTNSLGDGQDEPPEAYTSWLEDLVEYVGYIRDNIEGIHTVTDNAEALVYGTSGGYFDKNSGTWVEGTAIPAMAQKNARYYSTYIETQKNVATQAAADALTHKNAAATSAAQAAQSVTDAAAEVTKAANEVTKAAAEVAKAKTQADNAAASAAAALVSENAAKASENAAKTGETNAKTSETNAATSATNAQNSANDAQNSADAADASEAAAKASENAAAGSAVTAKSHEDAAKGHADDAEGFMNGAETHEENAEAWAVGQKKGVDVPTTDPAFQNNAKYWAEQAGQVVTSGGVASFYGRNGHVVPQTGDYTPAQVGAEPVGTVAAHNADANAHDFLFAKKADRIRSFTLTLQPGDFTGPTGEDGHYEADIADARIHNGNFAYLVSPTKASSKDYSEYAIWADDISTEGHIRFVAAIQPENPVSADVLEFDIDEV